MKTKKFSSFDSAVDFALKLFPSAYIEKQGHGARFYVSQKKVAIVTLFDSEVFQLRIC